MVIAFVLAIPLLLVLPVGLSRAGKMAALLIALLLSFLSLAAKPFFPTWQLAILVGLLVVALTYLLHRRFAHVFYLEKRVDDDEEFEAQDEQIGKTFEAESKNIDVLRGKEASADETPLEEIAMPIEAAGSVSLKNATADEEEEIISVDELLFEAAADAERIEAASENDGDKLKETPALDELPPEAAVEEAQPEHASEDEVFWETIEMAVQHENESVGPLSPAGAPHTELLDELPVAVMPELEEKMTVIPAAVQETEAGGEEKLPNLHTWNVLPDHLSLNENGLEAEEAKEMEWGEIIPAEIEMPKADRSGVIWRETIDEGGYRPAEQERDAGEEEQSVARQESSQKVPKNGTLILQVRSEVIQTVVDELRFNRKHMDPFQYEQHLMQCLQAPLPDHDYYVFARLLMEHYIFEKQYERLAAWLVQLQEKFRSYPIIQAEIQFLQEMAKKLQNGCGEKHEK
jgi:membrane protein implicated in regulation of membrane protease activity